MAPPFSLALARAPYLPELRIPISRRRRCSIPPLPSLPGLPLNQYPLATDRRFFAPLLRSTSVVTFGGCSSLRTKNDIRQDVGIAKASTSGVSPSDADDVSEILGTRKIERSTGGTSFLAKLTIAVGIAATLTVISCLTKQPTPGSSVSFPVLVDNLSHPAPPTSPIGFTFTLFGHRVLLPEYTPGWVYFWLLMAAGCGLFISEEALNVWVGITLARKLSLDGTWSSFAQSFSSNASYIISTILWVYWGVCISDMIPFYFGKLFRQTKASEDICSKLGIGKDKAVKITRAVQKYGNLIGFIERFSLGVRNPTAFLAGAWGISADYFFAGVCCGGIVTLTIQLGIGFLLREHPVIALASVATVVGMWTVFPYLFAATTALYLFVRRRYAS